jgi:hypothetical protein
MEGIQGIEFGEDEVTGIHEMISGKRNLGFQQDNIPKNLILLLICELW